MQKSTLVAKLRATSASLAIWLITSLILGGLTLFHWYPGFLFWADGGLQALRIICSVDLVLGPLLMFVAFNPAKSLRTRVIDVSTVIVIQLAAMAYGVYQMNQQAPAVVIYGAPEFHSVWGGMLEAQNSSPAAFASVSDNRPPLLFAVRPAPQDYQKVIDVLTHSGIPIYAQVKFIRPLKPHADELFAGDATLRQMLHDKAPQLLQQLNAEHPGNTAKLAWFAGRYDNALLIFDSDLHVAGYLKLPQNLENPIGDTVTSHAGAGAQAATAATSAASH